MNKTIPAMTQPTTSQSTQQATTPQLDPMQCVIIDLNKPGTKEVESRREDQLSWQVTADAQALPMTVEAEETSPASDSPMTVTDEVRYEELNAVVHRYKDACHELWLALQVIHDQRLYRKKYKSFKEYCEKEHGFVRSNGYRMIEAAEVVKELSRTEDTTRIKSVRQALEYKKAKKRELQRDTAPAERVVDAPPVFPVEDVSEVAEESASADDGEAEEPATAVTEPTQKIVPLDPTAGEPSEEDAGEDGIAPVSKPAHLATYTEMYERCSHAYNIFLDGELMKECLAAITSLRDDLRAYCEWEKSGHEEAA